MSGGLAKLAIGTAQFGFPYGISNRNSQISRADVHDILKRAHVAGVDMLDTAASYGDAEGVLAQFSETHGRIFRIVSKTNSLADRELDQVLDRARTSAELLGRLDALLVHNPADLAGSKGDRLWLALLGLVKEGVARRIGISAYANDHPMALADRFHPSIMQLPASVLDQRLIVDGTLHDLSARGIEIHIRSIFLQGLLFLEIEQLPSSLRHAAPELDRSRSLIRESGLGLVEAAVAFAMAQESVSRVVVGVTSATELQDIVSAATRALPAINWASMAMTDTRVLNPSEW